jgi:hypothetical protein
MSVTAKFNVGGTGFEVAVATIESQPEGLLAKMIDGRFPCGKDEHGAYFIDRNPEFFNIVLDVHRDNKVHPLSPGVTRERVVAELEFYGLQDFEADPMDFSGEATLRSVGDATREFRKWQHEHARVGKKMMIEGYARLLLAKADLVDDPRSTTLKICPLGLSSVLAESGFIFKQESITGMELTVYNLLGQEIILLSARCNMKATFEEKHTYTSPPTNPFKVIKLEPAEPAEPAAGA